MAALTFRQQERFRMQLERAPAGRCDWCGTQRGTDMHELIPRSRTVGHPEARERSYDRRLCAWLCRSCHAQSHHDAAATRLLALNIRRYGREAVRARYDALAALIPAALPPFPEEDCE